ncbi:alpha/beta hydrolase [Streptomyces canus]|uniref:alpha/beta hydrolase n=1 Tax=Streptomyces canus TaxID=58343 RepID=UPI00368AF894
MEDIRCAVDFLSNHPQVDPDRIGALGVCAGGGYTVSAAQTEARIKAVGTVSAFDVGSARREGVPRGLFSEEFRVQRLREITKNTPELYREGYDYCCTPRGQHQNAPGTYVFTSLDKQMAFDAFVAQAKEPKEVFVVDGATHKALVRLA